MSSGSDSNCSKGVSSYVSQTVPPPALNQSELNDLVRDLNISKDQSQILASILYERNMFTHDTSISYYKSRGSSFRKFFDVKDSFVFCASSKGLLLELGIRHCDACEWRLFIDSS